MLRKLDYKLMLVHLPPKEKRETVMHLLHASCVGTNEMVGESFTDQDYQ